MGKKIVSQLIVLLIQVLPKNIVKAGLDKMLDAVEDAVRDSSNKIDDVVVLPLCKILRGSLDIPDKD